MGLSNSKPFSHSELFALRKCVSTHVSLFYPVFGLKSHVDAFKLIRSNNYSNSPLELSIITPFIQPISKTQSNLQLLSQYNQSFWQYLDPLTIDPNNTIGLIDNDTGLPLPPKESLEVDKLIARMFSSEILQIDPNEYQLPLNQNNSNPEIDFNENQIQPSPMTFLKLSLMGRSEQLAEAFPRITNRNLKSALNPSSITTFKTEIDNILPIHVHPLPLLPINPTQLYPTEPTQIELRDKLFNGATIASNYQTSSEFIYQTPLPLSIQFNFPNGLALLEEMGMIASCIKPPTHMGTILFIDLICEKSVYQFYYFLHYIHNLLLHGSVLQFTNVELYILIFNMDKIDSYHVSPDEIVKLCCELGYDESLIHIQAIIGENVFARPFVDFTPQKPYANYIGQSLTQSEYKIFSPTLMTKIFAEYFSWVSFYNEINQPVQNKIIENKNQTNILFDDLFLRIMKPSQWPLYAQGAWRMYLPSVMVILGNIKLTTIFDLNKTPECILNDFTSKWNPSDPITLLTRHILYQYLKLIHKYRTNDDYKQIHTNVENINNIQLFKFSHINNPINYKLNYDIQEGIFGTGNSDPIKYIHNDYQSTGKNEYTSPIEYPQYISTSLQQLQHQHQNQSSNNSGDSNINNYQQISNLPTKFNMHGYICIHPQPLICDPLNILRIPQHEPSSSSILDGNNNELKNIPIPSTKPFQFDTKSLPPILQSIQITTPITLFEPVSHLASHSRSSIYTRLGRDVVDISMAKIFGITPYHRQSFLRRAPVIIPPRPITPLCITSLVMKNNTEQQQNQQENTQYHVHDYEIGNITFCRDYVHYTHQFKSNLSLFDTDTYQQQQQQHQQQQHDHNQQQQSQSVEMQPDNQQYKINLSLLTHHPNGKYGLSRQNPKDGGTISISDNVISSPHQESSLFLQRIPYTFIIKIIPFFYIREHFPLHFLHDTLTVPELLLDQPEITEKMYMKESIHINSNPDSFEDVIKTRKLLDNINTSRIKQGHKISLVDEYKDNRTNALQLPIPSLLATELYLSSYHSNNAPKYHAPKLLKDIVGINLLSCEDNFIPFHNQELRWFCNPLDFESPIHIVIFCINPVVADKTRNELHHDIQKSIIDKLQLNTDPIPFSPTTAHTNIVRNPAANSLYPTLIRDDTSPEPITQQEYHYLKATLPSLYKKEFLFKMAPFFGPVTTLEKVAKQFTFHFIAQHEWNQLYEDIQYNSVNQRIALYHNHCIKQ